MQDTFTQIDSLLQRASTEIDRAERVDQSGETAVRLEAIGFMADAFGKLSAAVSLLSEQVRQQSTQK